MVYRMYSVTYKLLMQNSITCVMLPNTEHSFVTHFLLVMQWDDCLAIKRVVYCDLLSVSHGMSWNESVQYTSRTHPLVHEMRYCLDSKCATALTFYLLWEEIRLSSRNKCGNTYILQNISWGMSCDKVICQKHDWLSIGNMIRFDGLLWTWSAIPLALTSCCSCNKILGGH